MNLKSLWTFQNLSSQQIGNYVYFIANDTSLIIHMPGFDFFRPKSIISWGKNSLNNWHCVKFGKIQAYSDPYFPTKGQNCIHIFSYMNRISDYTHIQENSETILSSYEKIRIRESRYTMWNIPEYGFSLTRQNIGFLWAIFSYVKTESTKENWYSGMF